MTNSTERLLPTDLSWLKWKAGSEIVLEKNPNFVTSNPEVEKSGSTEFRPGNRKIHT